MTNVESVDCICLDSVLGVCQIIEAAVDADAVSWHLGSSVEFVVFGAEVTGCWAREGEDDELDAFHVPASRCLCPAPPPPLRDCLLVVAEVDDVV